MAEQFYEVADMTYGRGVVQVQPMAFYSPKRLTRLSCRLRSSWHLELPQCIKHPIARTLSYNIELAKSRAERLQGALVKSNNVPGKEKADQDGNTDQIA